MAKVTISGTTGKTYNLDTITKENTRTDSSSALTVQIWYWSPESLDIDHQNPDPPNLVIGQIWLSKLVTDPELIEKLNSNGWNSEIGGA